MCIWRDMHDTLAVAASLSATTAMKFCAPCHPTYPKCTHTHTPTHTHTNTHTHIHTYTIHIHQLAFVASDSTTAAMDGAHLATRRAHPPAAHRCV